MLVSILIVLAAVLLFAGAFMLIRTAAYLKTTEPVEPAEPIDVIPELVAEHLASMIRCETVSNLEGAAPNRSAFLQLHRAIERWYPRLHEFLIRDYVNEYSLLYTWQGTRPDLPAVLLSAHLDVTPIDPSGADAWEHPPFAGDVVDGYVWGRGALDFKSHLVTLLDAVEYLLVAGYRPERTVYLAFGHDEELGGRSGAAAISQMLQDRGVELAAVLDEGGFILAPGLLPAVDEPVALVGTGEKGNLILHLTVEAPPWHSALPPRETAVGILARAIHRLESHPLPVRMRYVQQSYRSLGLFASPGIQFLFANRWLFGGMLRRSLERSPEIDAAIRTTTAATLVRGGIKENVLARRAEAAVNFRLLPDDSVEKVCEHVMRVIDDPRVQVRVVPEGAWDAPPVSPTDSAAYQGLEEVIRRTFNNIPVAPFLSPAASDSRHYAPLSENIYRFTPYLLSEDDIRRIHGIDERIRVEMLGRMVHFFVELIRTWAGGEALSPSPEPAEEETTDEVR